MRYIPLNRSVIHLNAPLLPWPEGAEHHGGGAWEGPPLCGGGEAGDRGAEVRGGRRRRSGQGPHRSVALMARRL